MSASDSVAIFAVGDKVFMRYYKWRHERGQRVHFALFLPCRAAWKEVTFMRRILECRCCSLVYLWRVCQVDGRRCRPRWRLTVAVRMSLLACVSMPCVNVVRFMLAPRHRHEVASWDTQEQEATDLKHEHVAKSQSLTRHPYPKTRNIKQEEDLTCVWRENVPSWTQTTDLSVKSFHPPSPGQYKIMYRLGQYDDSVAGETSFTVTFPRKGKTAVCFL